MASNNTLWRKVRTNVATVGKIYRLVPVTYIVTCPECSFRHEIGDLDDVFDFQEEHRAERGERHVLEFVLVH